MHARLAMAAGGRIALAGLALRGRYTYLLRAFLQLLLVGIIYWVAARLSLNLALVHGQVTPIWPPTGIAVVAILLVGRRAAAAIALAAFAVNLAIGPSVLGSAVIAAGNTLAPLPDPAQLAAGGRTWFPAG